MLFQKCGASSLCVLLSETGTMMTLCIGRKVHSFLQPFVCLWCQSQDQETQIYLICGLHEIPFPYLQCLKHLSALRLRRKRAEGPGMQQARPRNQQSSLAPAALFICPDLRFTPRILDLLTERSPCPEGICCNYVSSREGMQTAHRTHLLGEF